MTYPVIGSYGISEVENESEKIHAFGLIIKELCDTPSNSMNIRNIDRWLEGHGVPGVSGVDTTRCGKIG